MKRIVTYMALLACFYSCHPYYYYPSYQEVPTQTGKNELKVNTCSGLLAAVSASYTLTDHIGVMGNYNNYDRATDRDEYNNDSTLGKDSYIADIGAFYYGVNSF